MIYPRIRQSLLRIERIKRNRNGGTKMVARMEIARSLGVSLATVENIIKQKVKSVRADLAILINQLDRSTIEAERARLENEQQSNLELGLALVPHEMAETEALLEEARVHLREVAKRWKQP